MRAVDTSLQVDRLMALAFFPGRSPRSEAYREGCRAAIEYRITSTRIAAYYPVGSCEADAWAAGVEEGHGIWRAKVARSADDVTQAERRLLLAWRVMDDRSQKMIANFAAATAKDCPRRLAPNFCLVKGGKVQAQS